MKQAECKHVCARVRGVGGAVRTMWDRVASAMRAMRWDAWGRREMRKQHWHMFHTSSSVSRGPAPQRMQLPITSSSFMSVASSS
jgi:hypothetical protein